MIDLNGLKIIDFIGDGWAEENLKQFEVDWSVNLSSACKKVAASRGDIFFENEIVVLHTIKTIKNNEKNWRIAFDNIISLDAPIPPIKFRLLIHKESKFLYLLPKFDKTIGAMRKDGELDEIISKWNTCQASEKMVSKATLINWSTPLKSIKSSRTSLYLTPLLNFYIVFAGYQPETDTVRGIEPWRQANRIAGGSS